MILCRIFFLERRTNEEKDGSCRTEAALRRLPFMFPFCWEWGEAGSSAHLAAVVTRETSETPRVLSSLLR